MKREETVYMVTELTAYDGLNILGIFASRKHALEYAAEVANDANLLPTGETSWQLNSRYIDVEEWTLS